MNKMFTLVGLGLLVLSSVVSAAEYEFTMSELTESLDNSLSNGDRLGKLIGQEIEEELNAVGITFNEGDIIYSETFGSQELRGGCSANLRLNSASAEIVVDAESSKMKFELSALNKPITTTLDLIGSYTWLYLISDYSWKYT